MIDLKLLGHIDKAMPRMNKDIVNGLAVSQMNYVEEYINDIMRCAAESFPPGMKYVDGRRCTPLEQFKEIIRPLKPTHSFDLQRSDVYLMQYNFTYNGLPLKPHYIFLPFVSDGGLFYLKGTQYSITPVIGGKVFNIENGNIYMPTPRIRMGFGKYPVTCIANNKIINGSCIASRLHNMVRSKRSTLSPTLVHYMLAEYGLYNLMQKFNLNIQFGKEELDKLDTNEWIIYKSRQLPIITRKVTETEVSDLRIAVKKSEHYPLVDDIMGTVFYIVDNCVESTSNIADLNNPVLWLLLLDKFIFKDPTTERKQFNRMCDHLQSTKMSMDVITRKILASDNIFCNDIFDLFKYIVLNYQDITIHYDIGTMYYKELTTVKHVMYNVVYNIFMAMHTLNEISPESLSVAKINNELSRVLRNNKIFTTKGHGELTTGGLATDCKIFAATCNAISHSKATSIGGSKRAKKVVTDAALLVHESQTEVATYNWITHQCPYGRSKISPFVGFSERSFITPKDELKEDILALKELLRKLK